MNISSVVINLKSTEISSEISQILTQMQNIEVIAKENKKIVALIETDDLDPQIAVFRAIERIKGVESVSMIFDYDDENFAKNEADVAEILNDEKSENIKYSGDINAKINGF